MTMPCCDADNTALESLNEYEENRSDKMAKALFTTKQTIFFHFPAIQLFQFSSKPATHTSKNLIRKRRSSSTTGKTNNHFVLLAAYPFILRTESDIHQTAGLVYSRTKPTLYWKSDSKPGKWREWNGFRERVPNTAAVSFYFHAKKACQIQFSGKGMTFSISAVQRHENTTSNTFKLNKTELDSTGDSRTINSRERMDILGRSIASKSSRTYSMLCQTQ